MKRRGFLKLAASILPTIWISPKINAGIDTIGVEPVAKKGGFLVPQEYINELNEKLNSEGVLRLYTSRDVEIASLRCARPPEQSVSNSIDLQVEQSDSIGSGVIDNYELSLPDIIDEPLKGKVSLFGGDGDITLNSTTINAGDTVHVQSLTLDLE